jgi:Family of unknown function (DUF6134)
MIKDLLFVSTLLLTLPAWAASNTSWPFKVYLDDTLIGQHHFELLQRDSGQEIRSRARFDVKILFINAYRYRHENVERWRGDCLTSLTSNTDDNGSLHAVKAQARGDTLSLQVNGVPSPAANGCTMSFAYWNPAFLNATQLLHPQTGKLVDVRIQRVGSEPIKLGDQTVLSQRYSLRGPAMQIELWYSKKGEWLALDALTENGRTLRYRLDQLPACTPAAASRGRQAVCA